MKPGRRCTHHNLVVDLVEARCIRNIAFLDLICSFIENEHWLCNWLNTPDVTDVDIYIDEVAMSLYFIHTKIEIPPTDTHVSGRIRTCSRWLFFW